MIPIISILIWVSPLRGQSILKPKIEEVQPIEKFTFLVDANKLTVATTVRLEQMDILLGMDFTYEQWKLILGEFDVILEAFPQLPFFSDQVLKEEFAGLCLLGQHKFNDFHQHMSECMRFKNENINDTAVNLCSETPIQLKYSYLQRELQNIKNRYKYINAEWTINDVKNNPNYQNILWEFCSYYNDFSIVYERTSAELLTALEELSDGIYPEVLFGELIRNCTYSVNGDGEKYKVIRCEKNNKGYRCQIEITQAVGLKEYIRAYPVHYDGVTIMGYTPNDLFGRTLDVRELKYLDCDDRQSGDYAVCTENAIPEPCKSALSINNINEIINKCNFTKEEPPIGIILPHGGILIQGDKLTIKNGEASISQRAPLAIYSPEILTVKVEEEDYVFPPAIQIEKLVIVESKLTQKDIDYLIDTYEWEHFWNEVNTDDYIRYILLLIQLIIFPIAISGCYFTLKQRKMMKKFENNPKTKGKENFKNNQYLLRKI